jgi:hypothetical protein
MTLEAWQLLHTAHPRLFQEATLNYRGKHKPGQTFRAGIVRQNVGVAVQFEVIQKGKIKFIHENSPNMVTWSEIHAHFAGIDQRIPRFSCYLSEENRPYQDNMQLDFRLADGVDVPDMTEICGGAAGGGNQHGHILPSIVFQTTLIDTTGETKMLGALKELWYYRMMPTATQIRTAWRMRETMTLTNYGN